ncbi:MAG: hypothetical protein MJ232_06845, partial [archaeon]|nr:hypothetical protein [archaeon]
MSFRYCPLCGKKLDSKIEICLYCGHILNKELENESYNSFKKLANSIKSVLGRSLSKKDQNNYLIYLENNADKIKNIIDCFKIPTHYLDESKIKSDFLDAFEKVREIKKYNKNKELYLELDDKILVYSLSRIFDELKVAVLDANLHFTENQINDSKYKINEFNKIIDIKPPYKNFSTYKQETIKKEYSNLYNLLVEVNSFYLNNKDKLDYLEIKDISYFISNYEKLDAIFNKIHKKFDLYKKVEKINSLNLEESIFKIKENSSKKYNGQDLTNTEGLSEEFNQLNEKRNSCNNLYDDSIKILKEYSDLLNYDEKNIFKEFNQIYNNLLTEIDNLEKLLTIPKDIERLNKLKSSKYDHILTNLESNSIKNDFKNSYDNATSLKKYYSLSKKYFSNESKNTKKDSIDNYKLMYLNEIINSYENFDEVIIEINLNYEIDNKIKE